MRFGLICMPCEFVQQIAGDSKKQTTGPEQGSHTAQHQQYNNPQAGPSHVSQHQMRKPTIEPPKPQVPPMSAHELHRNIFEDLDIPDNCLNVMQHPTATFAAPTSIAHLTDTKTGKLRPEDYKERRLKEQKESREAHQQAEQVSVSNHGYCFVVNY